ncbi:glycoside hydrolase family 2 protein [Aliikangiella marina]|uniref:beta-mannosidase n=1 Tax=Aliikangiella marina TaxID=1712262 RepID=A0A545TBK2_9GAMM|nr:glycoside hydrolase family 2 protein [Aliikangiella marina]TQV74602.1 glycoside hydrolase family 2 protein [Aliikangiella marina]
MIQHLSDIAWQLAATDCDEVAAPQELSEDLIWIETKVPSTVGEAIEDSNTYKHLLNSIESKDWWYRCRFDLQSSPTSTKPKLVFGGLSTLAEVWLNGEAILMTDNMFVEHEVFLENLKNIDNELVIRFRSVENFVKRRHPRPGWKTKLVNNQNLRWVRTSLLGRIPGWTPPVVAVGPWKPIKLETGVQYSQVKLVTDLENNLGKVDFSCQLHSTEELTKAELIIGEITYLVNAETLDRESIRLIAQAEIEDPKLWWPHTHGNPMLYPVRLRVFTSETEIEWSIGEVGFRQLAIDQSGEEFEILVNDNPVFCRGACWTINNNLSLSGNLMLLEQQLVHFKQAGGNMIRIIGTMTYESDDFYQLCNRLGIMVWQDFMFANMDYPFSDSGFRQSVEQEIKQQVARLSKNPSLVMFCGNSEIQQQIAMLGFSKEHQQIKFYDEELAKFIKENTRQVEYISSSPFGGTLPFHVNQSVSHYYGVGAYQCSIAELRQHDVKFTSECLGFANIPIEHSRNKILNGDIPKIHNPNWKAATPRDSGAGWDFEDVRDYYLASEYSVETQKLRYEDPEKYLQLSELITGELMGRSFAEWRSRHSNCAGGLVWFMKDIQLGAGWGIYDSLGYPKACFYELKRHWQPLSVLLTNESINGIDAHVINESQENFSGHLVVALVNKRGFVATEVKKDISVKSRKSLTINLETVLGGFYDINHTYRFGPASHQLISVSLCDDETKLAESFYRVEKQVPLVDYEAKLEYQLTAIDDFRYQLKVSANKYIAAVTIKTPGYIAEDNFFSLMPNSPKTLELTRHCEYQGKFKGYISALNLSEEIKLRPTQQEVKG